MPKQQNEYIPPRYISTRQFGMGGLVTKEDPQDLTDTEGKYLSESPDLKNVIFDNGYIQPRFGSTLVLGPPSGETGSPTQLFITKTSDGKSYMIALYGVNFYLFEPSIPQWLNITGAVINTSGLNFGSVIWNINISDDRLYLGNGIDSTLKWQQFLSNLSVQALSTDTTITLNDSTHLPATGTVTVFNGSTPVQLTYTANGGLTGVLTLSGPVGQNIPVNSFVSTSIIALGAGVPKGKSFARFQGRLLIANGFGSETQVNGSISGEPENFTTGVNAGDAFTENITDGDGGITDIISFGQFLLICKEDSLNELSISISTDFTLQTITIAPLVQGDSVGPLSSLLDLQNSNVLYYPSRTNGIYEVIPSTTGTNASTKITTLSDNIYNTLIQSNFSFAKSRGTVFQRKLMWTASTLDNQAANDLILVYDLQRQNWSIWDNWNASDMKEYQGNLYFLSTDDSCLYFYDESSYADARGGIPIPYTAYAYGKRWDFSLPANNKDAGLIFVTGYIDLSTSMFIDVLLGAAGSLALITYEIDGSNTNYVKQVLSYGIGFKPIGTAGIGGVVPYSIGVFAAYLDIPMGYKWITAQVRPYSQDVGANWGLTGVAVNPDPVELIPPSLRISHI